MNGDTLSLVNFRVRKTPSQFLQYILSINSFPCPKNKYYTNAFICNILWEKSFFFIQQIDYYIDDDSRFLVFNKKQLV